MLKQKRVVGLTGGIASGKSEVSKIFSDLGAYIIDADVISREVVAPGTEGERLLKELFSEAFFSDGLNRKVLREIVFSDAEKLKKLNSVTHGLILGEIKRRIESIESGFVLVVIPLLFELGLEKDFESVICVTSSLETRIDRFIKRDNIDKKLALEMIDNQLSDFEREKKSDYIIRNDGGIEELRNSVKEVYEKILAEN